MISKKVLLIIAVVVIGTAGIGLYYNNQVFELIKGVNKNINDIKQADIGDTISKISSEILAPPPLNIGGVFNQNVLLQSKIILETNLARQDNGGLPVLKENAKLNEAAAAKALDMFTHQYFEHVSPAGVDPGVLVKNHAYDYITAGENLILGNFASEKEVVDAWMNSPGHRANILNNRYSEIGVAMVKGQYEGNTVWIGVQEFGLPISACDQPDENLQSKIDNSRQQLDLIGSQIDQIKKQINDEDPHSNAYKQMVDDYNKLVDQYNQLIQVTKDEISGYNAQVNTFNTCVAGN